MRPPPLAWGLPRSLRLLQTLPRLQSRHHSTTPTPFEILSTPTWSVRSLLPSSDASNGETPSITPSQLRHLLRLSALPLPESPAAEAKMIETLTSQLHFVRAIQQVDTTGVAPLRSIRDETAAGLEEATIGLDTVKAALDAEETWGHCKRPRRRRTPVDTKGVEDWDVLGGASETTRGYFVVRSAKGGEEP